MPFSCPFGNLCKNSSLHKLLFRIILMVGSSGFEPLTPCVWSKCSNPWANRPFLSLIHCLIRHNYHRSKCSIDALIPGHFSRCFALTKHYTCYMSIWSKSLTACSKLTISPIFLNLPLRTHCDLRVDSLVFWFPLIPQHWAWFKSRSGTLAYDRTICGIKWLTLDKEHCLISI